MTTDLVFTGCEQRYLRMLKVLVVVISCALIQICQAGIIFHSQTAGLAPQLEAHNEDDWVPVYRIYHGDNWNSHDDLLSQERSARNGDKDDSQFRSWKLDQWQHDKIKRVRLELYDDGDKVVELGFDGTLQNITSFFSSANLRYTNYIDIPTNGPSFQGDSFSFDGDGDARHWTVSSRHTGDCRNDEGWLQVIDKPKPGRDRCVCGYENVDKYPTIMYAKGNRKAKWSDQRSVGHADMMQLSISHVAYPMGPAPVQQVPEQQQQQQQQQQYQPVHTIQTIYGNPFDLI